MEQASKFGVLIEKFESGAGKRFFQKFRWMLPGLLIIGIMGFVIFEELMHGTVVEEQWELILFAIVPVVGLAWVLIVALRIRFFNTISVYEKGVLLDYGKGEFEFAYDEIRGMSGLRSNSTRIWGVIPVWTSRSMVISQADGKEITLANTRSPRLRLLCDVLNNAYTYHVTSGLTREKIHKAHFHFQGNFELEDGHFIFNRGGRREERIPLDQVRSISNSNNRYATQIVLDGPFAMARKGGTIALDGMQAINISILYHIIENA